MKRCSAGVNHLQLHPRWAAVTFGYGSKNWGEGGGGYRHQHIDAHKLFVELTIPERNSTVRQILSLICHTCRLRSGGRGGGRGAVPSVAWLLTIVCPNAPQVVWIQLDDVTAPTRVGGSRSLTCKYRHRMSDMCGQFAGLYRYEKKENL